MRGGGRFQKVSSRIYPYLYSKHSLRRINLLVFKLQDYSNAYLNILLSQFLYVRAFHIATRDSSSTYICIMVLSHILIFQNGSINIIVEFIRPLLYSSRLLDNIGMKHATIILVMIFYKKNNEQHLKGTITLAYFLAYNYKYYCGIPQTTIVEQLLSNN